MTIEQQSEKAAALLFLMGQESAAEVLKHLNPKEIQEVGGIMTQLKDVTKQEVSEVFNEFVKDVAQTTGMGMGNDAYVRQMLSGALGNDEADDLLDRIVFGESTKGLDSLKWMDAKSVADIIRYEHPQIMAIVLSYVEPDQSALVLNFLPENVRTDLMMRVASLDSVNPNALQELNDILESQFSGSKGAQKRRLGGHKRAADIMNLLDGNTESQMMEEIKDIDTDMGDHIEELMFVFADLGSIDDRSMQRLLRDIQQDKLLFAMKGADSNVKDKMFNNMSARAAELLRDDLEVSGPTKVSDVEGAQKEILTIARKLADKGEIILAGGSEEMI